MEIEQVQYFVAIARLGSFSAAAEELYISQSSLSKQISALERELGLQLIDRSKRKIGLTEAGETFLKHALQLTAQYQAMLAELADHRTNPTVSIVAIPVIAQYGITAYLAQLKSAYPQIQIKLEERKLRLFCPHSIAINMIWRLCATTISIEKNTPVWKCLPIGLRSLFRGSIATRGAARWAGRTLRREFHHVRQRHGRPRTGRGSLPQRRI